MWGHLAVLAVAAASAPPLLYPVNGSTFVGDLPVYVLQSAEAPQPAVWLIKCSDNSSQWTRLGATAEAGMWYSQLAPWGYTWYDLCLDDGHGLARTCHRVQAVMDPHTERLLMYLVVAYLVCIFVAFGTAMALFSA